MTNFEINAYGKHIVQPRVELYRVTDFMGNPMHGLAVVLDEISDNPEDCGQFAVLTVSFGEFIGAKDCAYIDTNNCPWAKQLLEFGVAEDTGFTHESGFCSYPLWHFNEEFLKECGGKNYELYSNEYDEYMHSFEPEEDIESPDADKYLSPEEMAKFDEEEARIEREDKMSEEDDPCPWDPWVEVEECEEDEEWKTWEEYEGDEER